MKKTSKYLVPLDPKIAGAVVDLCPQKTIGRSLSRFIEVQYNALEREHNELICQDCIISLPVEIVDTLEFLFPGRPFSDQVITAVRGLVAYEFPNEYISNSDYLRDLADLVSYYQSSGDSTIGSD